MEPYEQLDSVMAPLTSLIKGTDAQQLDDPTPCVRFSVRNLIEHMVGGLTVFGGLFRGEAAPQGDGGDVLAPDHATAWDRAVSSFDAAIHAPGALDRTIPFNGMDLPAPVFLRFVAFDGMVHSWDLATATGQPFDPPAALVAEVDGFARQAIGPAMRDGDTFAAEVEVGPDAAPIERLVAFAGRQPSLAGR